MDGAAPTFLNRTYEEAMALLLDARDYLTHHESADCRTLEMVPRLSVSRETLRITSRLTQVMAWLLIQKAVFAGEISRAEAAAGHHRLAGQRVCLDTAGGQFDGIPLRLSNLLERSHSLYARIARLDALVGAVAQ
jgi:regulator of CtrA degradation